MSKTTKKKVYKTKKKSKFIVYILFFFLGGLGIHRFYLERYFSALLLLEFSIASVLINLSWVQYVLNFIVIVWGIFDLFYIPSMVRTYNAQNLDLKEESKEN